jgi:prepilin-type processing-associated H-X9-DG protein
MVETSPIATSNIPLLGCTGPGDASEAILGVDIPGYMTAGERLGEAANDGPAFWNDATSRVTLLPKGQLILSTDGLTCAWCDDTLPTSTNPNPVTGPGTGPTNVDNGGSDGQLWLQDTRDWFCVHGGGQNLTCNILMADGSVKNVSDQNGDGYLNPGFPAIGGDENDGYRDDTVELDPFNIYSGPTIEADVLTSKTNFES